MKCKKVLYFNVLRKLLRAAFQLRHLVNQPRATLSRKRLEKTMLCQYQSVQLTKEDEADVTKTNKILMKASAAKEAEILRLCRNANYSVPLRTGQYLQTKPAVNSAEEWTQRAAELDKPLSARGEHTLLRRIRPNTVIGPVEELSIFHVGQNRGIDVKVLSTKDSSSPGWVNAYTKSIQTCRFVQDRENPVTRTYHVTKATSEGILMSSQLHGLP